ncbi:hypothetical protein Pelo_8320 [Pelomyxa schiedti]|nr:hypothetical protein Pelo_8320 [Pelomyxa schiedti]
MKHDDVKSKSGVVAASVANPGARSPCCGTPSLLKRMQIVPAGVSVPWYDALRGFTATIVDASFLGQPVHNLRVAASHHKKMSKNPKDWYAGYSTSVTVFAPFVGFQLFTKSTIMKTYANSIGISPHHLPLSRRIACGIGANALCAVPLCALENILSGVRVGNGVGIKSLWKGFIPLLARETVSAVVWTGASPIASNYLKSKGFSESKTIFLSSTAVSCTATAATLPFEVVKSAVQKSPVKISAVAAARNVVASGGARALFPALHIRMLRSVVSSVAWYYSYMYCDKLFVKKKEPNNNNNNKH